MAILTQKKILNVIPGITPQLTVHCSQSDEGSTVEFELYAGSVPFEPDGTASVQGIRKDGTGFGPEAVTLDGSTATVTLSTAMTGVAGPALCEITITETGGSVSTANFALLVEEAAFPNGPLVENSVDVYQQILQYVQSFPASAAADATAKVAAEAALRQAADQALQASIDAEATARANAVSAEATARAAADVQLQTEISGLQNAVGGPNVAATVAAMTDTSKVYVYTGSETGYTAGNWYYWNGSAWVSGGVYNSTAVQTDPTLSVPGMAADAAACGDLKSAIDDLTTESDSFVKSQTVVEPNYNAVNGVANYIGVKRNTPIDRVILHTNAKSVAENAYRMRFMEAEDKTSVLKEVFVTADADDGSMINLVFPCNNLIIDADSAYISFRCAGQSIYVPNNVNNNAEVCIANSTHPNYIITVDFYPTSPINAFYACFEIVYKEDYVNKIADGAVTTDKIADGAVTADKIAPSALPLFKLDLFDRVGVCGDSFCQGVSADSSGNWSNKNFSWFDKMANRCGIPYINCAVGGSTTRSWLTNSNGLAKAIAADPCDFYFLAWGINDSNLGTSYIGTEADIETKADTFYGNYATIIESLKNHAPNARFIALAIWYVDYPSSGYAAFNTAIEAIANHYGIPYVYQLNDPYFSTTAWRTQSQYHPTPLGYDGCASAMERVFDTCVRNNENYFRYANIEP